MKNLFICLLFCNSALAMTAKEANELVQENVNLTKKSEKIKADIREKEKIRACEEAEEDIARKAIEGEKEISFYDGHYFNQKSYIHCEKSLREHGFKAHIEIEETD